MATRTDRPTLRQRQGSVHKTDLTRLMNVAEVARFLSVDDRHVRRLVHERRIPFIKSGHLLRFDPVELTEWLEGHRRQPA